MRLRTIDNFLDVDQRLFAKSVVEDRAIPSCIDGLKPVQRKIIFVANKMWRSGSEKPMKVYQLGGQVSSIALYAHGDKSMNDAITFMGQSFKNNMPLLEGHGQYGSLRVPAAGAPRYIGTKLSKNVRLLYKDFELLENRMEEGYEIEPMFFLPIVPTVLINGSPGIAVGYSSNILNRNPEDVVDACIAWLGKKKPKELKPWLSEFRGTYTRDRENKNKWLVSGVYKIVNTTTVHVTDLPPSITFEKYEEYLETLIEKKTIVDYENNSSSGVDYVLKFTRASLKELIDSGKLEKILCVNSSETENVITIDENGHLLQFDTAEDIVPYFCAYRLTWYEKRKNHIVSVLERELMVLNNKARFVKSIVEKKLKVSNVPKKEICDWLESKKFDKVSNSFDYLINMPIHSLTKERYAELVKECTDKGKELAAMRVKVPSDMYMDDLKNLKKALKK